MNERVRRETSPPRHVTVEPGKLTGPDPGERMEREKDYVLRTVEERGVRLIRLWFTDVLGQLKSVAITPAELDTALEEGVQFDGTAIDGSAVSTSPTCLPDPMPPRSSCCRGRRRTSRRPDVLRHPEPRRDAVRGRPRQVLRRNLDEARRHGYSFFAAPEVEFFYFASGDPTLGRPQPLDQASYFDLTTADVSSDLRKRTIHMLEAMGIPIEYSFHEDSPSQHEIDLRYTEALDVADNLMTLRLVVKKIAPSGAPTRRSCRSR
ncbi:MAG: glutamine synthetase beta-grasp domain-containing protein [Acidimicrobiales bacterium]